MEIHILRKDLNNDSSIALSWTPGGRGKRGRPKTTWRRTVEKEKERKADGDPGLRRGLRLRTEMDGDVLLMPYVPQHAQGTKRLSNRKLMNRKINKISEVQ